VKYGRIICKNVTISYGNPSKILYISSVLWRIAWNGLHSYDPLCPDLECFSTGYQKGKSKVGFSDPSFAYGVTTLEKKACFLFLG
jgi:hypothetical protein